MQTSNWFKALASALLFGVATPFSKELLGLFSPFLLAGLFYLGASLFLLPRSLQLQAQDPLPRLSGKDQWHLLGSLFFGGMAGPVLLLWGLREASATSASLLLNLETLFTSLLAFGLFRENLSPKAWAANLGIMAAGMLLAFQGGASLGWGEFLIALACLAWGLDNNHTANIHSLDPVRCTFLKGVTFGLVNGAIGLSQGVGEVPWSAWGAALLIGAFSYGLSIVLYIASARGLGAARSQMVFSSAPFLGVLVAQVYLGEVMAPYQWAALGLLLAMLLLLLTEQHGHSHHHHALEHSHRHRHDDKHHLHPHQPPVTGWHSHPHQHQETTHSHPHLPDQHHRHEH